MTDGPPSGTPPRCHLIHHVGVFAPDTTLRRCQERATDLITRGVHLAFTADDRAQVDTFHTAAVAAGATSRHLPRHWPEYGAYCAFVTDPDGNNIEALVKDA